MAIDKEGKTEEPTGRRLEDTKKKGDVPRSRDLVSSIGLLFTIFFFVLFMPYFGSTLVMFMRKYFNSAADWTITASTASSYGGDFFGIYLKLVLPLFMLLIIVAFMVEVVQNGGIKIISENLRVKWEKFFVFAEIPRGLKKILGSAEALFELFKSLVKVVAIGFIAYISIAGDIPALLQLPGMPVGDILNKMGLVLLKLTFAVTLFLLVLAVLDYLWQRFRYKKKLKMSKQDIKDEFKQTEGDPQIKSRQRQIQFRWALRRMMAEVPEADVVITNPTHYAAALKYEYKKMQSPKLVAKGKDLIAERIKQVAREHDVPIVENPPVARAVYASVDIGEFIPRELFKPIAEILAYIYKLKGKKVS
jgi:flagellar biosynthetic protein FlhB